jgi:hypothetical protein
VRVHRSALKQGVSPEDAIQAAEWSLWIEPLDEGGAPRRELRLGFDTGARLLETLVLVLERGHEVVMNAMPARKKYLDLLPE